MLSDAANYVIVTSLMIVTMFLLFINVTKRNIVKKNSIRNEPNKIADQPANAENPPLVYPMYVDCSLSLTGYDTHYNENKSFTPLQN